MSNVSGTGGPSPEFDDLNKIPDEPEARTSKSSGHYFSTKGKDDFVSNVVDQALDGASVSPEQRSKLKKTASKALKNVKPDNNKSLDKATTTIQKAAKEAISKSDSKSDSKPELKPESEELEDATLTAKSEDNLEAIADNVGETEETSSHDPLLAKTTETNEKTSSLKDLIKEGVGKRETKEEFKSKKSFLEKNINFLRSDKKGGQDSPMGFLKMVTGKALGTMTGSNLSTYNSDLPVKSHRFKESELKNIREGLREKTADLRSALSEVTSGNLDEIIDSTEDEKARENMNSLLENIKDFEDQMRLDRKGFKDLCRDDKEGVEECLNSARELKELLPEGSEEAKELDALIGELDTASVIIDEYETPTPPTKGPSGSWLGRTFSNITDWCCMHPAVVSLGASLVATAPLKVAMVAIAAAGIVAATVALPGVGGLIVGALAVPGLMSIFSVMDVGVTGLTTIATYLILGEVAKGRNLGNEYEAPDIDLDRLTELVKPEDSEKTEETSSTPAAGLELANSDIQEMDLEEFLNPQNPVKVAQGGDPLLKTETGEDEEGEEDRAGVSGITDAEIKQLQEARKMANRLETFRLGT